MVAAAGGGFLVGHSAETKRGPVTPSTTSIVGSGSLKPFVGYWDHHGFHMVVRADGSGELAWRTYAQCGVDPPPCDLPFEESGWADFQVTLRSTTTAVAQVGGTTDPRVVPTSGFTIRADPQHDLLLLSLGPEGTTMCGPTASGPGTVNCGA